MNMRAKSKLATAHDIEKADDATPTEAPTAAAGRLQLTRNTGNHFAYETFTHAQAEASGIDKACFRPFPGVDTTDRAMKPQDITKR